MIHEIKNVIVGFLKTFSGSWAAYHTTFMLELEIIITDAEVLKWFNGPSKEILIWSLNFKSTGF
jgi:hypothetical protein